MKEEFTRARSSLVSREVRWSQEWIRRFGPGCRPRVLALIGAIILMVEIGAPYALHVFGAAYSANGTMTLRIIILLGPAYVIKDHYVSIRRAEQRMARGTCLEHHEHRDRHGSGGSGHRWCPVGPERYLSRLGGLCLVRGAALAPSGAARLSTCPGDPFRGA